MASLTDPITADRLHRTRKQIGYSLAWLLSTSTLFLLGAGALVTSTGSSLSVPDWPLAYGQWFPPMVGGIFYEHGHRMIATLVGLITTINAVWLWFYDPRRFVRWFGISLLVLVILQGVLGGITVIFLLPVPVSVGHAFTAQAFFLLTIFLTQMQAPGWNGYFKTAPAQEQGAPRTRLWALATLVLLFCTLLVGAIVRHTGAGLVIPDFPLAYGQIIPPLSAFPIVIHFTHRVLAYTTAIVVLLTLWQVLKHHGDKLHLKTPATAIAVLVVVQILLGGGVIWSFKSVPITTLHLMNGALLIGLTGLLALRAFLEESGVPAMLQGTRHPHGQT